MQKPNLRHLDAENLKEFFISKGEKPFRAKQVQEWIWEKAARSFEDMTNLSKETRTLLEENFVLDPITIDSQQISSDRTIKNEGRD